jgi:anti-anti-sigma factor
MTDPFEVRQHEYGAGVAWLVVRGEIDSDVSEILSATIVDAACRQNSAELVVDLRQVSLLAAAGIRALLEGRTAALRHGCGYRVANARGIVHHVLHITDLLDVLQVAPAPALAH